MIREDLVAERIAIDSYRDIIEYLADQVDRGATRVTSQSGSQ